MYSRGNVDGFHHSLVQNLERPGKRVAKSGGLCPIHLYFWLHNVPQLCITMVWILSVTFDYICCYCISGPVKMQQIRISLLWYIWHLNSLDSLESHEHFYSTNPSWNQKWLELVSVASRLLEELNGSISREMNSWCFVSGPFIWTWIVLNSLQVSLAPLLVKLPEITRFDHCSGRVFIQFIQGMI